MRRVAGVLAIGVVCIAHPVFASPAARLVYARAADAASCPDETALRGAVAARFGFDPFMPWADRTVVVEVWRRGAGYASRVQILDENGVASGSRELDSSDASCTDLFDATALAISIALDAATRSPAPPVPVEHAVSPADLTPTVPELSPPSRDAARVEPPPGDAAFSSPARWLVGFDVLGTAGMAPSVSTGIAGYGELRLHPFGLGLEARIDAPAGATSADGTRATSWLYAGSLVPCLHAGPAAFCSVTSLGQFVASGSGIHAPASGTALFAAVGARLGVEWALAERWSLRAHADGLVDLARPDYQVDGVQVWRAPPVAGTLALGLALRIP